MTKRLFLLLGLLSLVVFHTHAQTVYITKTGEKYHLSSCHYLSHSKIPMELSDALSEGYTACKVCRPTQDENAVKRNYADEKEDPETYMHKDPVKQKQVTIQYSTKNTAKSIKKIR